MFTSKIWICIQVGFLHPAKSPCLSHEIPMKFPWNPHEIPMKSPWNFTTTGFNLGAPTEPNRRGRSHAPGPSRWEDPTCQPRGFPWVLVIHWGFRGISWDFMGSILLGELSIVHGFYSCSRCPCVPKKVIIRYTENWHPPFKQAGFVNPGFTLVEILQVLRIAGSSCNVMGSHVDWKITNIWWHDHGIMGQGTGSSKSPDIWKQTSASSSAMCSSFHHIQGEVMLLQFLRKS